MRATASPARSRTPGRSASSSRRSSSTTTAARATVDDFGITTSAGALAFGAPVEAPADTFTYTAATLQVAPGTYTLAELALAGYDAVRLDLHQRRRRRLRRGQRHPRRGRPDGHLLDHQRRPAGQPRHPQGRRQRRRRHRDRRRLRDHHQRRRAGLRRPGRGPGRHLHLHRRDAPGRARHVHPRRARAGRLRARPPGPAPTATAAPSTRAASPSPRATRRSPARSPTTTSRSASSSARSSSTTTAARATVDDFGITTSAGALAFGAPVEAPADTFTYTAATLQVAPGTYTLAELALAGYAPVRLDLHQRRRRRLRRGQRHPRRGRPDGHLLDHQRRPAGQPRHPQGRRQRRRRHRDRRRLRDHHQRRRPGLRRPGRGPGRHLHLHRGDPPGRARHLHPRRARAGRLRARPTGPAPTATAVPSTRAASPSPRATRRSPARSPTTTSRSASSSARSSSTTTAAPRSSTTSGSPPAPAPWPSAPRSRPRPTPSPTPRRPSRSRPAPTPSPSSRWPATTPSDWTCTNGDGGAFDAGSVTLAAGDPTVTCSITNDDSVRAAGWVSVLPDSAGESGAPGSSPSGDPHIPWQAVLLTALIAVVASGLTIRRRWRSLDATRGRR